MGNERNVKVLHPAELIRPAALKYIVAHLQKRTKADTVVILASSKLSVKLPLMYMPSMSQQFRRDIALANGCPTGRVAEVLRLAGGDLRQIALMSRIPWAAASDTRHHVFFNVSDFFQGKKVPEDLLHYDKGLDWISHNATQPGDDHEAVASLAANVTMVDSTRSSVRRCHADEDEEPSNPDPLGINLQILRACRKDAGLKHRQTIQRVQVLWRRVRRCCLGAAILLPRHRQT